MIIAIFTGLIGGLIIGFAFNITYPTEYSFYITMALLAGMDSIVGAARAHLQEKYNGIVFITGFICNAILAALLTFVGDKLGIPLYYAAIFVFGGRLFNNMAVIRRIIVDNYLSKRNKM